MKVSRVTGKKGNQKPSKDKKDSFDYSKMIEKNLEQNDIFEEDAFFLEDGDVKKSKRSSDKRKQNTQKPKRQEKRNVKKETKIQSNRKDFNTSKGKKQTTELTFVAYCFVALFVLLIGNFVRFMYFDSKEVINNAYNRRQDLLADRVVRGKILAKNGEVLAHTVEDDEGNSGRIYPYKNLFSHVVGQFDKGKTGIELSENFNLLTSNTNPLEKVVNELSGKKNMGDSIVTTLDVELQKVAYNALGNQKGAVIVMEPSTGKIRAMVSKPDYDPNKIMQNWDALVQDDDSSLLNRVTQGLYPPGSTFKVVTALEYIREHKDYKKFRYNCTGKFTLGDMTINCYNHETHGKISLEKAFAKSCNSTFAAIGMMLNPSEWRRTCDELLFNQKLDVVFPYKKSQFTVDSKTTKTQIAQTAIGQGNTLITPLHNALLTCAIANGGTLMKPYVVDHIENYMGDVVEKNMPETYKTLLSPQEANILSGMMEQVVQDGTGYRLQSSSYQAAGKTGSAEYNKTDATHAWFIGFAPSSNPEIVVSIVVEGAGTGGRHAVPIAKKIMDTYFANKE